MSQTQTRKKTTVKNNDLVEDIISTEEENIKIDLKDVSTEAVKIDDGTLIKVRSNVFGRLTYKNSKSGDEVDWENNGDIQLLSMSDLRAMKSTQVSFFKNQWIIILGVENGSDCKAKPADIYKALSVTKYYENFIDPADYEELCNLSDGEIEERVGLLTDGAKENLAIALNEYISRGILDSVKKIKTFERVLGCDLARAE